VLISSILSPALFYFNGFPALRLAGNQRGEQAKYLLLPERERLCFFIQAIFQQVMIAQKIIDI